MVHMFELYGNRIALVEKMLDSLWGRQIVTLNPISQVDTSSSKPIYSGFGNIIRKKLTGASTGRKPNRRENIYSSIIQFN